MRSDLSCYNESQARPVVAAIAVVIRGSRVLLVRRANPPDIGYWGFPGGKIERGETIEQAAVRELFEETTIQGRPRQVFTAVDAFDCDEYGLLRQHFILIAVLCGWISGEPLAGDDATDAEWFTLDEVVEGSLILSSDVAKVAREAASLDEIEAAR